MTNMAEKIFERAYQSYLYGGSAYTYRFESKSPLMMNKYNKALEYLESEELIEIKSKNESKVKLVLTDKGVEYGNSISI